MHGLPSLRRHPLTSLSLLSDHRLSFVVVLLAFGMSSAGQQSPIETIHWDSTNTLFSGVDGGLSELRVHIKDTVKFVCGQENSIIYLVDNLPAAHYCKLDKSRKMVGICSKPGATIQLVIRRFNPRPDAPEFKKDKHHFLMSTSTGEDDDSGMNNEAGGLCRQKNMRLRVLVVSRKNVTGVVKHDSRRSTVSVGDADSSGMNGKPIGNAVPRPPDTTNGVTLSSAYRADQPNKWRSDSDRSSEQRVDDHVDYHIYYIDDMYDEERFPSSVGRLVLRWWSSVSMNLLALFISRYLLLS